MTGTDAIPLERQGMSGNLTIIFDLGRVLVNIDTRREKFAALMESMDIPVNQIFSIYWREPEVEMHMTGKISSLQFHQAATDRYNLKIDYAAFVDAWCDLLSPLPGMKALFDKIADRHPVGLLSDTDPLHWARAKELLPWLRRIPHPSLSFNIGYLKPHPETYKAAARDCETTPENCLFIDDSQINIDGARAVGMAAILFQGPERLAKDLTKIGII